MNALTTLVQSLGIAYASGISPYATVALAGLAARMGWIDSLPGALGAVSHPAVIGLASLLTGLEFLATLIPGVASLWETVHTAIRPPAAAALAVLTAWHGDPALIAAAALLGGGLGFATHATKLGLRYTIDTSPEPITNGMANVAELGAIAAITYALSNHPYITLGIALTVLVLLMLLVRSIWRAAKRAIRGVRGSVLSGTSDGRP
ncbi:MAG TPA: DUF4126 domain-containing protein [Gemmatimonadaceae bacterium]|nr:DUF4126 domain-containing protein [Gemmatimonadaceae bacterium]